MDFFLNWCITCGKRSEYLYCCNECRLNDLKKNKNSNVNKNNYTLEFKNRKPVHSHYKSSHGDNVNSSGRSMSPLLKINIPQQSTNSPSRNNSFNNSANSSSSSSSGFSTIYNSTSSSKQNLSDMIYLSPPKDDKLQLSSQKTRYYVQTFHSHKQNQQIKQMQPHKPHHQHLLTPLSENDNMEYETTSNNIINTSQMYSKEEVNENSSHWYWSSSDDEDYD